MDVDNRTLAGLKHGQARDHQRRVERPGVIDGGIAQRFGRLERHAADLTIGWPIGDLLGVHRAQPLARQVRRRDGALGRDGHFQLGLDEHARHQPTVGIRREDPNRHAPRRLVDHRRNERHPPGEGLPAIGAGGERHFLPVSQQRQVGLVGVQPHPDLREIGNGVDDRAGLDVLALRGLAANHNARDRRVDGQPFGRFARRQDPLDLLVGQTELPGLIPGSLGVGQGRITHKLAVIVGQFGDGAGGLDHFGLRR